MQNNRKTKEQISQKVHDYMNECCFDVQGLSSANLSSIAETQLARILTKIAIGSATVWWSMLELKDFINIRKSLKG